MRTTRWIALVAFFLALLPAAALAADFTFAVDVPTTISASTFLPYQLTAYHTGSPGTLGPGPLLPGLTADVQIDALDVYPDGDVAFSADAPFTVGGATFLPGDVVRYDGASGTYTRVLSCVSDLGLPGYANIDALSITGAGFIVSFDAPTTSGSATFLPGDLVSVTGGPGTYALSLFWSGAGLPAGSDICGLEVYSATRFYANFNAPVTLGGTLYQPGQILQYNGGAWSALAFSPSLPAGTTMTDFTFAGPGEVPKSATAPGTPLTVRKSVSGGAGNLDLAWGASCLPSASDYLIYEGQIGSWYSHSTQVRCTTGGTLAATITPSSGGRYYLVVPANGPVEGSYGKTSAGAQIPRSTNPCLPGQRLVPCS